MRRLEIINSNRGRGAARRLALSLVLSWFLSSSKARLSSSRRHRAAATPALQPAAVFCLPWGRILAELGIAAGDGRGKTRRRGSRAHAHDAVGGLDGGEAYRRAPERRPHRPRGLPFHRLGSSPRCCPQRAKASGGWYQSSEIFTALFPPLPRRKDGQVRCAWSSLINN